MMQLAVWEIGEDGPARLPRAGVGLEKYLEDWIERDPSLIFDGLRIVGRQVTLPSGGRLDLLAVSPEGNWVVVEIKTGTLHREVFTQALDYVESIATLAAPDLRKRLNRGSESDLQWVDELLEAEDEGPRETQILLVGVGIDIGLKRLTSYLSDNYDVPIRLVTFEVFSDSDGKKLLLREVMEREAPTQRKRNRYSVESIQTMAAEKGVSVLFEEVLNTAEELGLNCRAWPNSITLHLPYKGNLTLVYAKPLRSNTLHMGYKSHNFANLLPVTAEEVEGELGQNWIDLKTEGAQEFLASLRRLFEKIKERQQQED